MVMLGRRKEIRNTQRRARSVWAVQAQGTTRRDAGCVPHTDRISLRAGSGRCIFCVSVCSLNGSSDSAFLPHILRSTIYTPTYSPLHMLTLIKEGRACLALEHQCGLLEGSAWVLLIAGAPAPRATRREERGGGKGRRRKGRK